MADREALRIIVSAGHDPAKVTALVKAMPETQLSPMEPHPSRERRLQAIQDALKDLAPAVNAAPTQGFEEAKKAVVLK